MKLHPALVVVLAIGLRCVHGQDKTTTPTPTPSETTACKNKSKGIETQKKFPTFKPVFEVFEITIEAKLLKVSTCLHEIIKYQLLKLFFRWGVSIMFD